MSANTPLTDEQRNAVTEMRAMMNSALTSLPQGTAESVDERARLPDPESAPADVTVRVEIAPPSPQPHPLLNIAALKTPERVPIYSYALHSDRAEFDAEPADTHVIFFIHGGGNVTGHPTLAPFVQFYTQLLREVASLSGNVAAAAAAKCVLIAPSYRLATVPENTFPAALQDLVAAYDYVLGKGYNASNIVIAGDSAGGNHGQCALPLADTTRGTDLQRLVTALVLTHLILQSSRLSPRSVVAIAPSAMQASASDPTVSKDPKVQAGEDIPDVPVYKRARSAYLGDSGVSPMDPLLSGAFIPFTASWPRTLILVGTADTLIDASRVLGKRLATLQRPVELVEYAERPHGWWVMPHHFPENIQDAVQRIARFVLH